MDWSMVRYFKESEFNDDRGECWIKDELVHDLEEVRRMAGVPFVITSACRNERQNAEVGGGPESSHLTGYAVDISCPNSGKRWRIIKALIKSGFNRIGIGSDFIHVDRDPTKAPYVIWTY